MRAERLVVPAPRHDRRVRCQPVDGGAGEASGFGTHKRIELYGVLRGSRIGATAVWHNAIPPIPWLVFGMEAGFVPYRTSGDMASDEQAIYWGLIDLGVSHEVGGGR